MFHLGKINLYFWERILHSPKNIKFSMKKYITEIIHLGLLLSIANGINGQTRSKIHKINIEFQHSISFEGVKCFEVIREFKPITQKDTILSKTILIVDKSNNENSQDSIYRFLAFLNDSVSYFYENGDYVYFNPLNKTASKIISESTFSLIRKTPWFFFPLISKYPMLITKYRKEEETKILANENAYTINASEFIKEDSSCYHKKIKFTRTGDIEILTEEAFYKSCKEIEQYKLISVRELACNDSLFLKHKNNFHEFISGYSLTVNDVNKPYERKLKVGNIAPDWVGKDLTGDSIKLSDFTNGIMILDFWYSNCHPCWLAINALDSVYKEFRDSLDLKVIGINPVDVHYDNALEIFKERGKGTYPVIFTGKSVPRDYEVYGYPVIFIIDLPTKKILKIHEGYSKDLSFQIKEFLNKYKRGINLE